MAKRKSKRNRVKRAKIKRTWLERFFYLDLKKFFAVLVLWFLSLILHNLVFEFYGIEEPVFFLIAVVILPIYIIKSIIYTLAHKKVYKNTKV